MLPHVPSSSSSLLSESMNKYLLSEFVTKSDSLSNFLEYQKVRITPKQMFFLEAFEGKQYNKKITIQNCGNAAAFIRICPAGSYAFQIKPLVRGQHLPPGLRIVKNISFTYTRATTVPFACLPIHINGKQVDYKLIVSLSGVLISAIPEQIDFGIIDAGHSVAVRMLSLRNYGSKGTRFAIDLGRNETELTVEPSKGIIQPQQTLTIRLECAGTAEGSFSREFWVKCETPMRIPVKGRIVLPHLEPSHPNSTQDFTLIDFPKTYFGTKCISSLVIRNCSATAAVYCILADIKGGSMNLHDAYKFRADYQYFEISHAEGCFLPYEARVFEFTYLPKTSGNPGKTQEEKDTHSFCCVRLIRMPCMDLGQIIIPEPVAKAQEQDAFTRGQISDDAVSTSSQLLSIEDEPFRMHSQREIANQQTPVALTHMNRIVLFGEAESAGITIRPDSLHILQSLPNETITRELLLINHSSSLPIIFNYLKVSCLEVEPKSGRLPPSGRIEVCVTITPRKLGLMQTKIAFDLLFFNRPRDGNDLVFVGREEVQVTVNVQTVTTTLKPKFNMGITPRYIKEVGFLTDDIRFNTTIPTPRATLVKGIRNMLDGDLIAFPNDRPKSLRPWKNTINCRTICAGIPRAVSIKPDVYELSKSRHDLKVKVRDYYKNYLKKRGGPLSILSDPNLLDYQISNNQDLLLSNTPKIACSGKKYNITPNSHKFCIPLTPLHLNKVKVHPSYIKLGKMAPNTQSTRTVVILNQNEFFIRIHAKPRKPVISLPDGERQIVHPFQQVDMKITYNACTVIGHYNVIIDFIVNDNHTFTVALCVDIVPKCVKFNLEDIIFESNLETYKYLDIFNPVNVPLKFEWLLPSSSFTIEPARAIIPARRRLICCASYIPNHSAQAGVEATLCSENGRHQIVNVSAILHPPDVSVKNPKMTFHNLPLNLHQQGINVLKNLGSEFVTFVVLNPNPMKGISVSPIKGSFHGYSEQIFTVDVTISACITFSCTVDIEVQTVSLQFQIIGNVVYPQIIFKPTLLQLPKIVANASDCHVFLVSNKSLASATVEFRLEHYTEYIILDSHDFDARMPPVNKIELEADAQRELYLHFNPLGAASYCFQLPIVINDILGPAIPNVAETLNPSFYTEQNEKLYVEENKAKVEKMPSKMQTMTVSASVGADILRFSKLYLNFNHLPCSDLASDTSMELKIWNPSKDTCKFCLRTDELSKPFSLTYMTGNEIETLPYSIVCVLGPGEDVTFKAEFNSTSPGNFYIKLPIYIRHYLDGNIFNCLSFHGNFPSPIILAAQDDICLEPVPLKCETEHHFTIKAKYHQTECRITSETNVPGLKVIIDEGKLCAIAKHCKDLRVLLKYSAKVPTSFDSILTIFCTCGARCNITLKGFSDNCTLTTHPYVRSYTRALMSQPSITIPTSTFLLTTPLGLFSNTEIIHDVEIVVDDTSNIARSRTSFSVFHVNCNETCFPMFPADEDDSEYSKNMRQTLLALEEWLFHQVLYAKTYYVIPEGIATSQEGSNRSEGPGAKGGKNVLPQFVELLTNFIGPQCEEHVSIRKPPEGSLQRLNYTYNVYASIKDFIIKQGGLLPHVFPEHLLCFGDYQIFMKKIRPLRLEDTATVPREPLSEGRFFRISKQSWMDILLQTYKVFVLARVRRPIAQTDELPNETDANTTKKSKRGSKSKVEETIKVDWEFWNDLVISEPRNFNMFSDSEIILLHWLEYHFNRQRIVLWGRGEGIPGPKHIRFFDCDLNDGLVFIAVTTVYCPYLLPHLTDVYTRPTCAEQAFHNVSILLQAWNMLKLSFTITPKQIINPNALQILMLVNYLYEVLPTFSISETIKFKTGLSETCTESITIENSGKTNIAYQVIFFRNDRELFSVPNKVVCLKPHQKIKLPIKFYARNIVLEDVTMVLNGETPKSKYAKNMAFALIGEPVPSHTTTTVTVPSPLYQLLEVSLPIKSPYQGATEYDIHFAIEEPLDIETCKIIPWAIDRGRKVPKRLISKDDQLQFNKHAVGVMNLIVCCTTTNERTYWVVFKSASIGDFTIKVVSVVVPDVKMYIDVPVLLPEEFKMSTCSCKGGDVKMNTRCSRSVLVKIPCRNDFLWNAVGEMMMKVVDEKDIPFWQRYLGTNVGIEINKWMAEEPRNETSCDIQEIFDSTVNYVVLMNDVSLNVTLPSSTTIKNVHSLDHHVIPIHVDNDGDQPEDFNFTLESDNGLELRHYTVHFLTCRKDKICS